MTDEQKELYEEAKNHFLDSDPDDWGPISLFRLFTALQTIVLGWWRRPDGTTVEVEHNRLELLQEQIEAIPPGEKIIIWAKYHRALRQIVEALSRVYGRDAVCPYYGAQRPREQAEQLRRWRGEGRFLVATQDLAAEGLTLNESATTIFYADSFKFDKRANAEDRNHRIGQGRRPTYTTLRCRRSIDDRIADSLAGKENVLDAFTKRLNVYRATGLKDRAIEMVRSL